MQIKVIKKDSNQTEKDSNQTQNDELVNLNSKAESPKLNNVEKKAERNISKWVSELRQKKEIEFLHSKNFWQGLKHAV